MYRNPDATQSHIIALQKGIRASDRFEESYIQYRSGYVTGFRRHPVLPYILSEEARYYIVIEFLRLHYGNIVGEIANGATVSRLKEFAVRYELASPNRVVAMIGLMKYGGIVREQQSADDRRLRRIELTDFGFDVMNGELDTHFASIVMLGNRTYQPAIHLTDEFRYLFFQNMIDLCFKSHKVLTYMPAMRLFSDKHCAYEILLKLLMMKTSDQIEGFRVVQTSFIELSDYFTVSRAHVRNVIGSAADAGYLKVIEKGGKRIGISPIIEDLSRNYVALILAFTKTAMDAAAEGKKLYQ